MKEFFEQNLEDIIFESKDVIHLRGFIKMHPVNFRQFRLPSGKKIDLLSCYSRINVFTLNIIELKRDVVDDEALIQAIRYASELRKFLRFGRVSFEITLVGSKAYPLTIQETLDPSITVKAFTYSYDFDGIRFTEAEISSAASDEFDTFRIAISAAQYGIIPADNNVCSTYKRLVGDSESKSTLLKICQSLDKKRDDALAAVNSLGCISNGQY